MHTSNLLELKKRYLPFLIKSMNCIFLTSFGRRNYERVKRPTFCEVCRFVEQSARKDKTPDIQWECFFPFLLTWSICFWLYLSLVVFCVHLQKFYSWLFTFLWTFSLWYYHETFQCIFLSIYLYSIYRHILIDGFE